MDDRDVSSDSDQDAAREEREKRVSRHDSALEAELERRRSTAAAKLASEQGQTSEDLNPSGPTGQHVSIAHEPAQQHHQPLEEAVKEAEAISSEPLARKRKASASSETSSSRLKRLRSNDDYGGSGRATDQSDSQTHDTQGDRPLVSTESSIERTIAESTGSQNLRGQRRQGSRRAATRQSQALVGASEGSPEGDRFDRPGRRSRLPSPPPPSRLHELYGPGREKYASHIRAFKAAQVRMPWLYGKRRRKKHWHSEEDYRKDPFNLSHTYDAEHDINRLRERFGLTPQPMRPTNGLTMMDLELVELGYWLSIEPTGPAPDHSLWNSVPEWADVALDMYHDFLRDANLPQLPLFARLPQVSALPSEKSDITQTDATTVREWHLDALKDALGAHRERLYDDSDDPYNASIELDDAHRALGDLLDAEGDAVAPARQRLAEILQRPEHGGEEESTTAKSTPESIRIPPEPMGRGTPPRPAWIHKGSFPARRLPARLLASRGTSTFKTPFHQRPLLFESLHATRTSAPQPPSAPSTILGSNDEARPTATPTSDQRATSSIPTRPSSGSRHRKRRPRRDRQPLDAFPPVDALKPPPESAFSSYSVEQLNDFKAQLAAEIAALEAENGDDFDDTGIDSDDEITQSVEQEWSSDLGTLSEGEDAGRVGIIDPHQRRAFDSPKDDPAFMTEDEQVQHAVKLSMQAPSESPRGTQPIDSRSPSSTLPHHDHLVSGIPSDSAEDAWNRFNGSNLDEMTDDQRLEVALKMSVQEASQDPDDLNDEQQLDLALRMSIQEASEDDSNESPPPQPSTPMMSPRALPSTPHSASQETPTEPLPPQPSTPTLRPRNLPSLSRSPPQDDLPAPETDISATELGPDADKGVIAIRRHKHLPRKTKSQEDRRQRAISATPRKCTGSRTFSVIAREVMRREAIAHTLQIREERRRSQAIDEAESPTTAPHGNRAGVQQATASVPSSDGNDGDDPRVARDGTPSPTAESVKAGRRRKRRPLAIDRWLDEQVDPPMTEHEWRVRTSIIEQLQGLPSPRPHDRWLTCTERLMHEYSEYVPRQSPHYGGWPSQDLVGSDDLENRGAYDPMADATTRRRSDRNAQEQDPVALVQAAMNNAQSYDSIEQEDQDTAQEIQRVLTAREAIRHRARATLRDEPAAEESAGGQGQPSQGFSRIALNAGHGRNEKSPSTARNTAKASDALTERGSRDQSQAQTIGYANSVSHSVKDAFDASSRGTTTEQARVPPDISSDLKPLYHIFQESQDSGISWNEFVKGVQGMARLDTEHTPAPWSAEWFARKFQSWKAPRESKADRPPTRGKDTPTTTQTSRRREREGTPAPWSSQTSDPAPPFPTSDDAIPEPSENDDDEESDPNTRADEEQARKERLADEWAPRLRYGPWSESSEWWLRWAIKAGFLDRLIEQKKRREERKRKRQESGQDPDDWKAAEDGKRDGKDRTEGKDGERDELEDSPSKKRK